MDLVAVRNKNNPDSNNSEGRTALRRNILDSKYNSEERNPLMRTYKRRARRRDRETPEELVWEILLWLPPKTLARFKSVCRAWLSIISSPPFISMHLRQSASRNECEPSYLVATYTPNSMPETWHPDKVPFYHWQQQETGNGNACLVHTMDLPGDAGNAHKPMHCDGLVLLPTDTRLYVFNPGTGHVLKLPKSQNTLYSEAAGLGLDLGTNTYKVACSFYRSEDYVKQTYSVGMQVFTIGAHHGSCWRTLEDPPYPLKMLPAYFQGSLYWHIQRELLQTPVQGFVRLDLQEEKFDFIAHPVLPSDRYDLHFIQLGGKLCLYQRLPTQGVFWTSSLPSGDNNQWHRVYVINNLPKMGWKPIRFLGDWILFQSGYHIHRHDMATGTTEEVANVDLMRYKDPRTGNLDFVGQGRSYTFIIPYTASLVPLPKSAT